MTSQRYSHDQVDLKRPSLAAVEAKGSWQAMKWLVLRRTAQVGFLFVFLSGPWFGLWITKGTLASSMTLDVLPLTDPLIALQSFLAGHTLASTAILGTVILAVAYAAIGGRAYCSWVCPVNLITDAASWLHRRLDIKKGWQPRRQLRYWLLATVLIASMATGSILWEVVNPITVLHRELVFGTLWFSGFALTLIAVLFVFDIFVSRHGWCGHLCPVGAFYGLIGRFRLPVFTAVKRDACDNCMLCYAVCPEPHVISPALKPKSTDMSPCILSIDCTLCGRCADVCPHDVFKLTTRFRDRPLPDRSGSGNSEPLPDAA